MQKKEYKMPNYNKLDNSLTLDWESVKAEKLGFWELLVLSSGSNSLQQCSQYTKAEITKKNAFFCGKARFSSFSQEKALLEF